MIPHEHELKSIPDLKGKALHHVFEQEMVSDNGLWLEFGVYMGGSIRRMASRTSKPIIFGFDSFEGLPEAWERPDAWMGRWDVGSFDLGGRMPKVPPHVTLIKGWYENTVPVFSHRIRKEGLSISLLHIDSDIYSSCSHILNGLVKSLGAGAIVVFDELVGYENFEKHEWKAWWEFVEKYDISFEWIGGNRSRLIDPLPPIRGVRFDSDRVGANAEAVSPSWENVAVRITDNPYFDPRTDN